MIWFSGFNKSSHSGDGNTMAELKVVFLSNNVGFNC